MARKVFISFLGTSFYNECIYYADGYESKKVKYIQEATLEYLSGKETWTKDDVAYILLTTDAKQLNWEDDGHRDRNTGEVKPNVGLKRVLTASSLPMTIKPIEDLPLGINKEEIMQIFDSVFQEIEDGDELYIDFTHGFRYLSMLMLVLSNYARFLKHTIVRSITYGQFESVPGNRKPIIDLTSFSLLQEWTYAAGQYLDSGKVDKLVSLCHNEYQPILRETRGKDEGAKQLRRFTETLKNVTEERLMCRGISIVESKNFTKLKENVDQMETTFIKPLTPIFHKVKESLDGFDVNMNATNGYAAAKWCLHNGMYQQALTIFYENITTELCLMYGLDWKTESERGIINAALNTKKDSTKKDWRLDNDITSNKESCAKAYYIINDIHHQENFDEFIKLRNRVRDLRNDYNHSGMRCNATDAIGLMQSCHEAMSDLLKFNLINRWSPKDAVDSKLVNISNHPNKFVNISNHPSAIWGEAQLAAASEYGEVIDMSFPNVLPTATSEEVEKIASELFDTVCSLGSPDNVTIHIMGEMTLTFALVNRLKEVGYTCLASTTQRIVEVKETGEKITTFHFEQFRKY